MSCAIAAGCGLAPASQSPYILRVMRKRKQYLWEVSRVGGTPATFIAVYAADEKQALKDGRAE
jgi:hypothetical protein